MHRPFLFVALAATTLTVSACRSIPDYSAWKESNADVAEAVTTGFQSAASVNGGIAERLAIAPDAEAFADAAARYRAIAASLDERSQAYEVVFGAIADYASSLDAIAKASENSQQTVDAVAGSLNNLVSAVGFLPLSGAGFELGKTLATEVIKIKAAHDFTEAVEKADPVVQQIADLLKKDLADLAQTVSVTKNEAVIAAFTEPYKARREYRIALERRRADVQKALGTAVAPRATTPGAPPPATVSLGSNESVSGLAEELSQLDSLIADTDAWYGPMNTELESALSTLSTSAQLVTHAARAVDAWRDSHKSLAAASRERRMPESGRLAAIAVRIRTLADELKNKD